MNSIKILLVFFFGSIVTGINAQSNRNTSINNKTTFTVYGACIQCKTRIEEAILGRGVKTANWDIETKQLYLEYNPEKISLDKIKEKIVSVGHDLDDKKANNIVYNKLPKCCLYRDTDAKTSHTYDEINVGNSGVVDSVINNVPTETFHSSTMIKGIVLEENNKGKFSGLANASVFWYGTNNGVITGTDGIFSIATLPSNNLLIISYAGYKSDTIEVTPNDELRIILATDQQLKEVTVNSKKQSTYINNFSPIRTQIMTGKELLKAACCNLSESFETNPSVDVSYNDAVTGSKQIQLLGLSGNYVQLTVENLPGPRGIATALGLNSIAGPWIESIQLSKGVGSVANGYESISGQINVELKKPEAAEKFLANIYANDGGRTEVNVNFSKKINSKWSAGLLLHDDFLMNKHLDYNKDGFRDLPTGNNISLVNRYKFDNNMGMMVQFGIKLLKEKRIGGEVAFDPKIDKNTNNHYGLGINTDRLEAFAKIGYVFPEKKYKSIGLAISGISHKQNSYFGYTTYNAKQQTIYGNLIYQSIINTTIHKFRAGASFLFDKYDEEFKLVNYKRTQIVPGVFAEYTYTPVEKFSAILGLRVDHDNLVGFFVTPRLNIKYEPLKGTTIRLSAGRGQRTANIFAENTGVFVSARQVNIITPYTGYAYGLKPEIAWNKGVSVDQKFKLFDNDALLSLDFFRNDFTNQVVVDLEDAREIKFYNLQGKSFSNSFQAQLNMEPIEKLEVRLAYRLFDVKTEYSGKLMQRPFISKHRAFSNLAYDLKGFKFDYTIIFNGVKRLPDTKANPVAYQFPNHSPSFVTMNAQVSKTIGKKLPLDIYVGAENITNYFQKDVILSADQPFSNNFDASLIWGPVSGRMFYAGLRLSVK